MICQRINYLVLAILNHQTLAILNLQTVANIRFQNGGRWKRLRRMPIVSIPLGWLRRLPVFELFFVISTFILPKIYQTSLYIFNLTSSPVNLN